MTLTWSNGTHLQRVTVSSWCNPVLVIRPPVASRELYLLLDEKIGPGQGKFLCRREPKLAENRWPNLQTAI